VCGAETGVRESSGPDAAASAAERMFRVDALLSAGERLENRRKRQRETMPGLFPGSAGRSGEKAVEARTGDAPERPRRDFSGEFVFRSDIGPLSEADKKIPIVAGDAYSPDEETHPAAFFAASTDTGDSGAGSLAKAAAGPGETDYEPSFLKDSTFDFHRNEAEEALFRVNKKNEEFQELLDEEFERLSNRRRPVPGAPLSDASGADATEAAGRADSFDILASQENGKSVIEDRIQEYLRRADERIAADSAKNIEGVAASSPSPSVAVAVAVAVAVPTATVAAAEAAGKGAPVSEELAPPPTVSEPQGVQVETASADGQQQPVPVADRAAGIEEPLAELEAAIAAESETSIPKDIAKAPVFEPIPVNVEKDERRERILDELFGKIEDREEVPAPETVAAEEQPEASAAEGQPEAPAMEGQPEADVAEEPPETAEAEEQLETAATTVTEVQLGAAAEGMSSEEASAEEGTPQDDMEGTAGRQSQDTEGVAGEQPQDVEGAATGVPQDTEGAAIEQAQGDTVSAEGQTPDITATSAGEQTQYTASLAEDQVQDTASVTEEQALGTASEDEEAAGQVFPEAKGTASKELQPAAKSYGLQDDPVLQSVPFVAETGEVSKGISPESKPSEGESKPKDDKGLPEGEGESALSAFSKKEDESVSAAEEPKVPEEPQKTVKKPAKKAKSSIASGILSALVTLAIILVVLVIVGLLLLKFAPDSVGAYYLMDLIELVKTKLGIGG
jgi:hypothetical protein